MSASQQYEFTEGQNLELASLAANMRFVGTFSVLFGLLALLLTALLLTFIFRDRLPGEFRVRAKEYLEKAKEKLDDELRKEAAEYSPEKVPPGNTFLWGSALFCGLTGLVFLMQGVWVRSSAGSFQRIVDTQGGDISHLMDAVGSLRKLFSVYYTLLSLALLGALVAVGLSIYQHLVAR